MCMMCDEETLYLDYLSYLHGLLVEKRQAGEDVAEIEKVLSDHGFLNGPAKASLDPPQVAAPPANPASPFSCDPVDE